MVGGVVPTQSIPRAYLVFSTNVTLEPKDMVAVPPTVTDEVAFADEAMVPVNCPDEFTLNNATLNKVIPDPPVATNKFTVPTVCVRMEVKYIKNNLPVVAEI